ncbi:uncharacterized protein LOC117171130 [Belonocnema kinseyi]|uniref:uncharacterized protein LOC117171130 n=1 Tax=Belonocnema kinseyi TaxID=2817044 RepID=UPI00143CFC5A|nr:uncharacterized protein LOC117171130 [Belonocnema kinseyi]
MEKLEIAFMTQFGHEVLDRFNKTSKFLQTVELDLVTGDKMLQSLTEFINEMRNKFDEIQKNAKKLGCFVSQHYSDENKRIKRKKFPNSNVETSPSLNGEEKFKIESFHTMVDKLKMEIQKRSSAYSKITEIFGFLTNLREMNLKDIKKSASKFVDFYTEDLEVTLATELEQFVPFLKSAHKDRKLSALTIFKWMSDSEITSIFPNVYIAYRLFLTIPITNCEAEPSFSTLARVKSELRSTMSDKRLTGLSLLGIEKDLRKTLSFEDLIKEFANAKARKNFVFT